MSEEYPTQENEREKWGEVDRRERKREKEGGVREGSKMRGACANMTQYNPKNKKKKKKKKVDFWFFRYERAKKKIVENCGHFMICALLDVAQVLVLRPPVYCNLTTVKQNLGQCSESVISILKLNRDTGC